MLRVERTTRFKREFKKAQKRGYDMQRFKEAVRLLETQKSLPHRYKDHPLTGNWVGHRECHLAPDWLLIYKVTDKELLLVRTGSHADLFE